MRTLACDKVITKPNLSIKVILCMYLNWNSLLMNLNLPETFFFHRIGLIGAIYLLSFRDGKALTSFPLNEPKTWR